MQPVVCMITDRHRLDGGHADRLVQRIAFAARAGTHLIQVRERDLDGGPLARLVRSSIEAVRGTSTRILVNDRLDVALAAGAHGVHLRSDSIAAKRARMMTPPGFLLGRSIHSAEEAARASGEGGLDYLIWGTLFPTQSKPNQTPAGVAELRAAVAATPLPVLAIGGIAAENATLVAKSGAAGFAAIGLFAGSSDDEFLTILRCTTNAFVTGSGVIS